MNKLLNYVKHSHLHSCLIYQSHLYTRKCAFLYHSINFDRFPFVRIHCFCVFFLYQFCSNFPTFFLLSEYIKQIFSILCNDYNRFLFLSKFLNLYGTLKMPQNGHFPFTLKCIYRIKIDQIKSHYL